MTNVGRLTTKMLTQIVRSLCRKLLLIAVKCSENTESSALSIPV
jgi:hypothetical protein